MFNLFDSVVVSRAEQSRVSYNLQTEEFRHLNANLEIYLGDIKIIDNDNHQLQETIEQIRTKYIITLENHLKRLPNDFRLQSQILTDAHIERYKFKSRTRRFLSEREELKRRIHFVSINEKTQIKYLNHLQKQERLIENEFNQLNEEFQYVLKYVENEKEIYHQAMNQIDQLQIQLEQSYIERSKTEFEIQTLKEEVQLMQNTKEFLDEECQTILSTQIEANEDFLSRLNNSINRIREDFNQLNKTQLEQTENEYQQILQTFEENQRSNISQEINPSQSEQILNEQQIVSQELTTLNDQNQNFSQQILAMENELYTLRNERMEQLLTKDNELESSKIELQTLNEKLNHLAEYDRNLKFELTLYRGVLESEYKRKQSLTNMPHLIRPITLRTNKNSITDRTTWLTSNTIQGKANNQQQQQQQEILTTRNRTQSDYNAFVDNTNVSINDIISTQTSSNDEKSLSGESSQQQVIESNNEKEQSDNKGTDIITQGAEKTSSSLSITVPTEDQPTSSSRTSSVATETQRTPTSSTAPLVPQEDQLLSSQVLRSSSTPVEHQSSAVQSPSQTTSLTNDIPFISYVGQSSSPTSQEHQRLSEEQEASSRTSSISIGTSSQIPTQEQQSPSRTSSISAGTSSDIQKSPLTDVTPSISEFQPSTLNIRETPSTLLQEDQPSSHSSTISEKTSTDKQDEPLIDVTSTVPEYQLSTSDVQQPSSIPPQEDQPSSRTSSISAKTSSDMQESPLPSTTPKVLEYRPPTSDIRQSPSLDSEEHHQSSLTSSISAGTSSDIQKSLTGAISTVPKYELSTSDIRELPPTPLQEEQPSSRTSSISTGTQESSVSSNPSQLQSSSTVPLSDQTTSVTNTTPFAFEVRQSSSPTPQEHQTLSEAQEASSRTSSISTGTPSEAQKSPSLITTSTAPEYQSSTSAIPEPASVSEQEEQLLSRSSTKSIETSSDIEKSTLTDAATAVPELETSTTDVLQTSSTLLQDDEPSSRTSSISAKSSSDMQESLLASTPIFSEHHPPNSDIRELPSTPQQEDHPSSRTSTTSEKASSDTQESPNTVTTPATLEYQPSSSDIRELSSTSQQEDQPSSRTSTTSEKASSDIQESPDAATTSTTLEYQPPTVDVHESPSTVFENYQTLSEVQNSSTTTADVEEKPLPITADDNQLTSSKGEFGSENQLTKSLNESDDNLQYEESLSYTADEKATNEVDRNASRESIYSTGPSSVEEFEVSVHMKPNNLQSSSFTLTNTSQEESKQNLSESETNISSNNDNKSEMKQDETLNQINTEEEDINSSFMNQTEENKSTANLSSITNSENNLNEFNSLLLKNTNKQSSRSSSLADIEEVDDSTSQKLETKSDENDDDPSLSIIMQDLRYVFHELASDDDLVEIDDDLPNKILDRLEFHDQFIQTLFDGLIRKYLVQAANQSNRPQTLDWVEFRDILFPIISGRYTERHVRKLFDLFDTGHDGYLSLQEIAELLEVLHANDTINLAQNIIEEFDADHDGKLSVDELIEAMKNTEDINEHALSEETENKQWFNLSPTENQTITLEVPVIKFSPKIDERFTKGILLLGRIFRRIGANSENKQLDISNKKYLSMQITNEFINNDINISSDDLQLFIQLFLERKQTTDSLINWIEFREIFFPIINHGFYTKNQIKLWFDLFDTNQNRMIDQNQLIHLLHLLQIQNSDELINKLIEITNNNDSWTLDELIFALDSVDETALHVLTNHEQLTSFDNDWFSNNISN